MMCNDDHDGQVNHGMHIRISLLLPLLHPARQLVRQLRYATLFLRLPATTLYLQISYIVTFVPVRVGECNALKLFLPTVAVLVFELCSFLVCVGVLRFF